MAVTQAFCKGASSGIQLAYWLRQGANNTRLPLVLIHGLGCTNNDWGDFVSKFPTERTVITLDNRGIGESTVPEQPFTLADMADDVASLLDHLQIKEAAVMGVSMGGMIAENFAIKYADRCKKLILGCTTFGGKETVASKESKEFFKMQQRMLQEKWDRERGTRESMKFAFPEAWRKANPERYEWEIQNQLKSRRTAKGYMYHIMAIQGHDMKDELHKIECPTLVIHGTEDHVIPVENGKLVSMCIKQSVFAQLNGEGHNFWASAGEPSARAIETFIEQSSRL
eukprot:Clim_evm10s141 gene=Clim_evmTU10s141